MASQVIVKETMPCTACKTDTLHLQSDEGFWQCEVCGDNTLAMTRIEWAQFTN